MFTPTTPKIQNITEIYDLIHPERMKNLSSIFEKETGIYIDLANVRPWQKHLRWNIDMKRLYQFFRSFSTVKRIVIYQGTLLGDAVSEKYIKELVEIGYEVRTKPVKIMKKYIDTTSIARDNPSLLRDFIRSTLMRELQVKDIEYLNGCLSDMNKRGITVLEDRKCNFDVEIGVDMMLDLRTGNVENFILMSGDSDFHDVLSQILGQKKKAYLFATVRRVARELQSLTQNGLKVYEIKKIKNFICKNEQFDDPFKKAKGIRTSRTPQP